MKIIAITSLALNVLVIGTGAGLYFNRGKIIDMALDKGSMPSLPTKTGLPSMPRF